MPDQPDHDAMYETLETIHETTEPTRLRITLDTGWQITGHVTDSSYFGSSGIDITIDFPHPVTHEDVTAHVGHITQYEGEAATLSLSAGDEQPVVADVDRVERVPED